MSNFMEDIEEVLPKTALEEVMKHVIEMERLQEVIAMEEEKLKAIKERESKFRLETIPQLLLRNGLEGLVLTGIGKLEIKEDLTLRIPENAEGRKVAMDFLVNNGGAELIKDELILRDAPESIKTVLQEKAIPFESKMSVNTNSLKAWAREKLGMKKNAIQSLQQSEFPKEVGLFVYREAKIKR